MINVEITSENSYKIKEMLEDKICEKISEELSFLLNQKTMLNENRLKECLEKAVVDIFSRKLNPFMDRIMKKFEKELELLKDHLIEHNQKVLNLFSKGANLENVIVEYIDVPVDKKQNAEDLAMEYYKSQGLKTMKFDVWLLKRVEKHLFNTITNLLSKQHTNNVGAPDLIVYDNCNSNMFFLVEVKTDGDGPRQAQMLWYKNHPDVLVKILYVNQIVRLESEDKKE